MQSYNYAAPDTFRRRIHRRSLAHHIFSRGWPATQITPSTRIDFCSQWRGPMCQEHGTIVGTGSSILVWFNFAKKKLSMKFPLPPSAKVNTPLTSEDAHTTSQKRTTRLLYSIWTVWQWQPKAVQIHVHSHYPNRHYTSNPNTNTNPYATIKQLVIVGDTQLIYSSMSYVSRNICTRQMLLHG